MPKLADYQLGTGGPLKPFEFPHTRSDGQKVTIKVVLRVLSKAEIDVARLNGAKTAEDLCKDVREAKTREELLDEAKTVEIISAAMRVPENPSEIFADPIQIAQTFHPATIVTISRAWEAHQAQYSPLASDMTPEQFEATLELIAREGSADPLLLCGWPLLSAFITTTAKALLTARMDKSSLSSQSTRPSSESESEETPAASDGHAADEIGTLHDDVGELAAEVGVMRNELASMRVRLTNVEAGLATANAAAPSAP